MPIILGTDELDEMKQEWWIGFCARGKKKMDFYWNIIVL